MEIRRRIGFPRSFFHVMNRGARKVSIFADDTDRKIFRGLLGRFAEKYAVRILGWCLMPNHYHLEPDADGTSLSHMMRDLDATYARSFNERHGAVGCLFQGPFKSILIRDDDGLAYVNRYIHMNPVDLRHSPEAYRWSSCPVYLGIQPAPAWMDLEPVMRCLRGPERSDSESYAYYLQEGLHGRKRKRKRSTNPVRGFYLDWIRHLEERCVEKLIGMEEILGGLAVSTVVTWLAHRVHKVPAEEVARFYGYGSPGVVRSIAHRMQERIDQDSALAAVLERMVPRC